MVDTHKVLFENYNGNDSPTITDTPNIQAHFIPMNDSDQLKYSDQQAIQQGNEVKSDSAIEVNLDYETRQNVHRKLDDPGEIMCGLSQQNSTDATIQSIHNDTSANSVSVVHNGETSPVTLNHFPTKQIETLNETTNTECTILKNCLTSESNGSQQKETIPSTSINSADHKKAEEYSADLQSNSNIVVENQIGATVPIAENKMDSRKVEPLRININRDPIKTKIKLGPPPSERQTMSPKSSSSSNNDECDNVSEMQHENQQIYPKITIKPIVKPPSEAEHHHNHGTSSHTSSSSSSSSSTSSHEAIPKLKIKKVDSNISNSNLAPMPTHATALNSDEPIGNYQTHLLSESSPNVPKLATVRGSTTNLSIGSNSYDSGNCTASNEVVPKLTIKLDNHSHSTSTDSPRSLVSAAGVKLTLKPLAEPPIPKFTITNAFNDTAKVVMLNNSEQTDESSDEQPSQPPSSQPSPNDKVSSRTDYTTHAITSTSSSYSGANVEDNLSTCSSASSSSYSSSSSVTNPNNDIKLIIKATSTGSCIVSPNPASVVRNSPSSGKPLNNLKVSSSKCSGGFSSSEQPKLNSITSNVVTSSTVNSSDSIPKLNIKLSNTEYPQVIHNETELNESRNEIGRTGSPLPKLTIRMGNTHDDTNIVIPKVTIKPVVNPNEMSDPTSAEAQLVTPKIILKSIPKPIEKPLEIITAGQGSPFRNADSESQQSPRIILKINKNTTSQTKESSTLTSTTIIATEEPHTRIDSPQPIKQNELKRSNHEPVEFQSKKQKLNSDNVEDVVDISSSDSELDQQLTTNNNHNDSNQDPTSLPHVLSQSVTRVEETIAAAPSTPPSFDTNSGLRSILSRPQMKIQPQPLQNFLQTLPPFKSTTNDSSTKLNDVIDLCHDSNDQLIDAPVDAELMPPAPLEADDQPIEPIDTNKTVPNKQRNAEQSSKSNYWQYFYSESEKEQIEPIHPLLQQNIERANVLAAMMEAANKQEHSTNGSNNNNTAKDKAFEQTTSSNNLLIENEGSSSDCIVIEDTASEPFPNEYASADNSLEQNGRKKDCVDRDSGVDVSNSIKSVNEEETTAAVKRPRGRPRKGTTPKTVVKNKGKTPGPKRKFTGVTESQANIEAEDRSMDETFVSETLSTLDVSIGTPLLETPKLESKTENHIENTTSPIQQSSTALTVSNTLTPTLPVPSTLINMSEINKMPLEQIPLLEPSISQIDTSIAMDTSPLIELPVTPVSENVMINKTPALISPTTPTVPKERKRRIIIDDDDESPTFNPQRSNKKIRGKNRRNRHNLLLKKQQKAQLLSQSFADKQNEAAVFTSPESIDRRKLLLKDTSTAGLQVFEEDTRMSADSLFTSPTARTTEFLQNEESQSSLHSSTSATVENSTKKVRSKIEVVDPEGRTEFTVDMIAEYDWPPPKGCCPSRNRDTFMIQEQIAEYLGVKSFKRKYPDLPRRMVDMEERNYLMEKGLVSEKMCDLGLTAVLASDVLDIMNNDFFEKYEEYRRYLREKQIRDLAARQKQLQAGVLGKSLSVRENAMRAASIWNADFNRSRNESRRECLDLQNFVVQTPDFYRKQQNRPVTKPLNYPIALVPGQFQEYYRKYSPAELLCYPINSVLADPYELDRKLREYYNKMRRSHYNSGDESGSDSDTSSESDSDDSDSSDDSSSSSSDESTDVEGEIKTEVKTEARDKTNEVKPPKDCQNPALKVDKAERQKCQVCNGPERCNTQKKPEIFISCTTCKRNAHPSCLKMSARMVRRSNEYAWQCKKCKQCIKCRRSDNEDKMLFCDQCDRSYHIYCIGLRKIPNGKWHCAVCTVCTLCGARRPEGHNNPNLTLQQKQKLLAVAKWTHEYQDNPATGEQEHVSVLCTSCMAIKHSAAKNVYFN